MVYVTYKCITDTEHIDCFNIHQNKLIDELFLGPWIGAATNCQIKYLNKWRQNKINLFFTLVILPTTQAMF